MKGYIDMKRLMVIISTNLRQDYEMWAVFTALVVNSTTAMPIAAPRLRWSQILRIYVLSVKSGGMFVSKPPPNTNKGVFLGEVQ